MRRVIFLTSLLFSLSATADEHVRIDVSESLMPEHRELLVKDFVRLEKSPIRRKDSDANLLFEVSEIDRSTLIEWLNARVKVLVRRDFISLDLIKVGELPDEVIVLESDRVFVNPDVLPEPLAPNTQAIGLADNLGTGLYILGKFTKQLFGVLLPDEEKFLPVSSPRVGLIGLEHSLFDSWITDNIKFQDKRLSGSPNSRLASEYRLATLFHEARHSDGNGKSLGFLHVICPKGHDFAGKPSCDKVNNGGYSIQGTYFQLARRYYRTEAEREAMRVFAADAFSRVLDFSVGWDAKPEGLE